MGICSSCLGGRRSRDSYDDDEESPLFDDANLQYGSFGEQNISSQDDDMEAQREMEALQRVVAKTSDNMVDIFEIAPQTNASRPSPSPFAYAGQEARIMRYRNLLSKLAAGDAEEGVVDGVQVDWIPRDEDVIELQDGNVNGNGNDVHVAKGEDDNPLVGTFADAAAAMR